MRPSLAGEETSEGTFDRLYRRHRGDVYRFVLRDLRNPDDAEDVTQAAFLNAYCALQGGTEPEKPRAWLFTIAQNVTRRRFRSRAARPHEVELDPDALVAPEPEAPSAAEIREGLRRLRPNQRAVIVLREIGGLSYAEIAGTLGLSVSAVETLLFRSRRALREELAAAEEEQAVVRVGGVVLWPLPAALSDAFGSVAAWLGPRAVTAKVAGAAGAVVIGTGAVVSAGAVPLPGADRAPEPKLPAVVTLVADASAARAAAPAKPVAKKPKRASAAAGGGRRTRERERTAPVAEDGVAGLVGALSGLTLPQTELPPVDVPKLSVPTLTLPSASEPSSPAAELSELPEPELPPLPAAEDLLP